jgi:ERCC4-type nuclease
MIIADYRERKVMEYLDKKKFRIKPLKVADFIISNRCALERKTVSDFVNSITDKRIFRQAEEMGSYERSVLVIEGDGLFDLPGIHPNALLGAISSLILDYGMVILCTRDAAETARLVLAMDNREGKKLGEIPLRNKKRPKQMELLRQCLLEGFPDVGPILAKRIMQEFKTPLEFFNSSEKEMRKVRGLGKKKVGAIRRVMGSD